MQRTKRSIVNLITAFIGQIFGIIISFIVRMIFVNCLSSEYLGINGLFTNILTMLSLVELGVGSAMTYSLYKPIVLAIGIGFTPFYRCLINEIPNIPNLDLIYILFVVNTGVSYFYSYKRSLIICDQKKYITTLYKYGFLKRISPVRTCNRYLYFPYHRHLPPHSSKSRILLGN